MQGINYLLSSDHFTENDVLAIKPITTDKSNEKLGAVCILAGIGHRKQIGLIVRQFEVFIFKFSSVDGLSSSAVVVGEVSSLSHEVVDDSVEA